MFVRVMTVAQLQCPAAQYLSPSRLRRAHHRKAYGDSHAEPAGKQNSKPNKHASVSSAARRLQNSDPRYQRRVANFTLLAGRRGGHAEWSCGCHTCFWRGRKVDNQHPSDWCVLSFLFYVKFLLAQSLRQAMVWLQARSRTAYLA